MNYCNITVGGRIVREIELKTSASGISYSRNAIAWDNKRNKDGGDSTFLDFTIFGKGAELMEQYLAKGQPVILTGYLEQSNWETEAGEKRSKIAMVADRMDFAGGAKDDDDNGNRPTRSSSPPKAKTKTKRDFDDAIPF